MSDSQVDRRVLKIGDGVTALGAQAMADLIIAALSLDGDETTLDVQGAIVRISVGPLIGHQTVTGISLVSNGDDESDIAGD